MKKIIMFLLPIFSFFIGFYTKSIVLKQNENIDNVIEKAVTNIAREKPLEKYTIENLTKSNIEAGKLEIKKEIYDGKGYKSYLFEFVLNPNLDDTTSKKVTGQINFPFDDSKPIDPKGLIVMFRGYVDQELYRTGDGTRNTSAYFSENGYITIAPDFLGYADSNKEAEDIFESRFQTYITAVTLLNTVDGQKNRKTYISGPNELVKIVVKDNLPVFIWGHSNGGQIALTALEITSAKFPTTLWAPVSKMFPYSILYYTDESEDRGKLIRFELSKFEENYDVDKYSLDLYLDNINAPMQIQQGTNDDAVPIEWTDNFVNELRNLDIEVTYNKYPGADHNMKPNWDDAVQNDLNFFNSYLD